MIKVRTLVLGGGASGITAAISAGRKGDAVIICDRMPRIGKKILASGNGRCNLLNENLDASFYNPSAAGLVKKIFSKFGKDSIAGFFKGLGLELCSKGAQIFPATDQSSSVLRILEMELARLSVPVELNFEVTRISRRPQGFTALSKNGRTIECEKLIIAGGARSYPALGSNGSCFFLAADLGHRIIEPVPAAVPVVVKDRLCHLLQGQKISATVRAVIDGKESGKSSGDLLFTRYGLSGTAILDVSEEISIAINRQNKKDVRVLADLVPFMDEGALKNNIAKRLSQKIPPEDLLAGILPNKFSPALKELLTGGDAGTITRALKSMIFNITGTKSWNEAEFTAGGVDVSQVKDTTLESRSVKNLYFAGEVLDVCGRRGGYNLAWAWASGFVAGETG